MKITTKDAGTCKFSGAHVFVYTMERYRVTIGETVTIYDTWEEVDEAIKVARAAAREEDPTCK